jgi:hypothetical protein
MTERLPPAAILRLAALSAALVALALTASGASAAKRERGVRVLNSESHVVALFRSAKCRINKLGFYSDAFDRRYHLEANVLSAPGAPFAGFKQYPLERGHATQVYVALKSPSGVYYASDFVPPYPVHGGGALNFSSDGKLLGIGFSPMFSEDGSDAVTVAGVLKCKYPKKKKRR